MFGGDGAGGGPPPRPPLPMNGGAGCDGGGRKFDGGGGSGLAGPNPIGFCTCCGGETLFLPVGGCCGASGGSVVAAVNTIEGVLTEISCSSSPSSSSSYLS